LRRRNPEFTRLFDGKRVFYEDWRSPSGRGRPRQKPKVRVEMANRWSHRESDEIRKILWPHENVARLTNRMELLPESSQAPAGCIGIRVWTTEKNGRDHYVDPTKDYIRVKEVRWGNRNGRAEKGQVQELSGFRRLPGGQFYPTKRVWINPSDLDRNGKPRTSTSRIDVKVLKPNEFPPGIFDGEKLLEGAKVESN